MNSRRAFTLIELLVVVAIIGIIAALLLPALSKASASAKRATCLGNIKQVNTGLRMFADDSDGFLPNTNNVMFFYKELMKAYVGLSGTSSPSDRVFICPADHFNIDTLQNRIVSGSVHSTPDSDFSSYAFNGLNRLSEFLPGIAGKKLDAATDPTRTVLVAEYPAFNAFSWHAPARSPQANDTKSVFSFIDGHAAYTKTFWNGVAGKTDLPMFYDPPVAGYDYTWRE
jgi:prepilin-type N-terminal cleavage/methylation domain-containing protein